MACSQCHDLRVYLCLLQRSACASVMNVTRLNILGGSVWWSTVCFGVWDRIFTCCLGDIQIFQLQAQPIACFTTAVIHPIYCEMMFLLSACKTRVEASLLIVVFGLQPAAFSFFFLVSFPGGASMPVQRRSWSRGRNNVMLQALAPQFFKAFYWKYTFLKM